MESSSKEFDDNLDNVIELIWSSDPNSSYDMYRMLEKLTIEKHGNAKSLHKLKEKPIPTYDLSVVKDEVTEDLMDFFEDDLKCVVCSDITVSYRNQLMECEKCHLIYHQNCHVPSVQELKLGVTWTCHKCLEKVSKVEESKENSPTSGNDEISEITKFLQKLKTTTASKAVKKSNEKRIIRKLFGTTDKPTKSNTKSEPITERRKKFLSLKARENLQEQNHATKPSTSKPKIDISQSSHKMNFRSTGPTINIVSAEKRLYYMKKRAAESCRLRRQ